MLNASNQEEMDLTGKLLIAMPGMGDPRFERAVIYVCAYSDEAAMGLIVNRTTDDLTFSELLKQLDIASDIELPPSRAETPIYVGGPVEHGRGFVLHSTDYRSEGATLEVSPSFGMTATVDILEDMARGKGPENAILALGYSGWGPGQLEGEITRNGWLTCDATPEIVFGTGDADKWTEALNSLGVDPRLLSGDAGRA
ncbi:YqgE/AlgH family protein [Oceanicola sp. D3]|uniref:YqgE/AlgH family protein n=1 Tax=Oceanicola sp. D3 TaxID=2587163 RepID=UPI0011241F3D|nr:YqgE/AlgH family protein [Oceanicola sp. D3]QDC07816.1 YqgE/AlgH family protein [Oceanicola sp. D3]